ncbi:MAG: Fic family protein [Gammaproteobacteria bacterium]|nr:MAG: Fic family protein [Gammaproteobacteria bacterium]
MPTMQPYLPKELPIKELNYGELFSLGIRASSALARFDGLLNGLVNPSVLMGPLSVQEAQFSSRIEDIYATIEDVLTQGAGGHLGEKNVDEQLDILEIINYRATLESSQHAISEGGEIDLHLIRAMHQTLMEGARGSDKSPGEFRKDQNWIAPKGCTIEDAIFVPVSPFELDSALKSLIQYVQYDDMDHIAQAGILHAQFELIHPFRDGNGRVGRLLIPLFLYYKKQLSLPMFYISGYLEKNRKEYLDRLAMLSSTNDWHGWLTFFYSAVIEQSEVNAVKVQQLMSLYEDTKEKVRIVANSKYSDAMTDALFQGAIFSIPQLVRTTSIPKPSIVQLLAKLEKADIVKVYTEGAGTKAKTYFFPELLIATSEMSIVNNNK